MLEAKIIPNQLKNVNVPWSISPSMSYIELKIAEYEVPTLIFAISIANPDGIIHSVKVTFEQGARVRVTPAMRDGDMVGGIKYDWSLIPFHDNGGEDVDDWLLRYSQEWISTGICPLLSVYEVIDSKWKASLPSRESEKLHLIFMGQEILVECLTRDWHWEYLEE